VVGVRAIADFRFSCRKEIAEIPAIAVTLDIFREFYVRGLDWHWHCVLPGLMDEVENGDDDDGLEGGRITLPVFSG
jgi:hypothetical protein